MAGRTSGNTVVNFRAAAGGFDGAAAENLMGRLVRVRITESGPFSLRGALTDPLAAHWSADNGASAEPAGASDWKPVPQTGADSAQAL